MEKKKHSIIGFIAATLFALLTLSQLLIASSFVPNIVSEISGSDLPDYLLSGFLSSFFSSLLRAAAYCLIALSILLRKPRALGITGAALLILGTLISLFPTFEGMLPYLLWYDFTGLIERFGLTLAGDFLSLLAAATVPVIFLAPQKAAKGLWCLPAVARLVCIVFSVVRNLVVWWDQPETLSALFSFYSILSYLAILAAWVLLGLWVAENSTESQVL